MGLRLLTPQEVAAADARLEQADSATPPRPRCSCGRFVARGGTCSLSIPVYRDGSYLGREHP